jgi:enoyl-CoA hydratase/carnithine racemase
VEGTASEWQRLQLTREIRHSIKMFPAITIARIYDDDRGAGPVPDLCDLVALEKDDPAEDRLGEWLAAAARRPHAATVLAQLLRSDEPTLAAESFAYSMLQSGPEHAAWLAIHPPGASRGGATRVAVEDSGGVRHIRLVRPEKHNAVDSRMRAELADALATLELGSRMPATLLGDGPSFSSGGDLDEFGSRRNPVESHFARSGWSPAAHLDRLRGRVVAGIHGAAIGAGIELACFAAHVVAAESVRIRLPELEFGLLPGSGGTVSIRGRIGPRALLDLGLRAVELDAASALRLRLVDEVVRSQDLDTRVGERAARLKVSP